MTICFISAAVSGYAGTYTVGLVELEPWDTAYVAAEMGFWKSEGSEVEIKQFDDYMGGNVKALLTYNPVFSTVEL